jgi:DNA-binding transcriptional ArsR family regulator
MEQALKLSYSSILYHLNKLREEKVILRIGEKKPFKWRVTEFGQQSFLSYLISD